MEGKKISFGFMKTKKENKPLVAENKEYIDCVEEKSIKVVGGEKIEDETPLVIPMKPNTLITAERLKEIAEKVENFDEKETKDDKSENKDVPNNETLDQMAVRELLEDAKKEKVVETPTLVVPINAKPVFEGQKESTLDDYDSVPVQEFGLAMLRGMGWTPSNDQTKFKQPQLRPKGLGLGADKMIKENQKNKSSKDKDKDENLSIVKTSFVRITSGKHSGYYGKVVSLDEDNGRVMVDITVKKETVSLSEFMMQPVTKSEYDKQSKVINTESYEEYKKKETLKSTKQNNTIKVEDIKKAGSSSKNSNDARVRDSYKVEDRREKQEEERPRRNEDKYSNGKNGNTSRERYRKDSSSSEEERSHHRKKYKKKYSSNESLISELEEESSRHRKKNKKKYSSHESLTSESDSRQKSVGRRRHSSSDSSESNYRREKSKKNKTPKEKKRDIDKKRKGKKKKRDRDRSPNCKKYRK